MMGAGDGNPLHSLKDQANGLPILNVAKALQACGLRLCESGKRLTAHCPCPGHEDEHPSVKFYRQNHKGHWRWKCQACGGGGDNIQLVQTVRQCSFPDALRWLQDRFNLSGDSYSGGADLREQWASIRQVDSVSVSAFGAELKGSYILFPMRYGHGQPPCGRQKRRADNMPITSDGKRSICEGGGHTALFIPLKWAEPCADDQLVICEGEPDAIAAHSCGFPFSVGTPGQNWGADVQEAMGRIADPFSQVVLVPHGDVSAQQVFTLAQMLSGAGRHLRVVWVPPWVSTDLDGRDLNAWLQVAGKDQVRQGIRNESGYTPLRHDAIPNILRAVEQQGKLAKKKRQAIELIARNLFEKVWALDHRPDHDPPVGPAEWFTTWQIVADWGYLETRRQARYSLERLRAAGVLTWDDFPGRRRNKKPGGIRIRIYNICGYVKTSLRTWEHHVGKSFPQLVDASPNRTTLTLAAKGRA